jgi:hypothetical protein
MQHKSIFKTCVTFPHNHDRFIAEFNVDFKPSYAYFSVPQYVLQSCPLTHHFETKQNTFLVVCSIPPPQQPLYLAFEWKTVPYLLIDGRISMVKEIKKNRCMGMEALFDNSVEFVGQWSQHMTAHFNKGICDLIVSNRNQFVTQHQITGRTQKSKIPATIKSEMSSLTSEANNVHGAVYNTDTDGRYVLLFTVRRQMQLGLVSKAKELEFIHQTDALYSLDFITFMKTVSIMKKRKREKED